MNLRVMGQKQLDSGACTSLGALPQPLLMSSLCLCLWWALAPLLPPDAAKPCLTFFLPLDTSLLHLDGQAVRGESEGGGQHSTVTLGFWLGNGPQQQHKQQSRMHAQLHCLGEVSTPTQVGLVV